MAPGKIKFDTLVLDQMDSTDLYIYKLSCQRSKYTLFSNAHGKFSKIHDVIGHETILNKFKKTEII